MDAEAQKGDLRSNSIEFIRLLSMPKTLTNRISFTAMTPASSVNLVKKRGWHFSWIPLAMFSHLPLEDVDLWH